jgi:hypothetical protein
MRNIATNMQRRIRTFAICAAMLSILPLAQGANVLHVKWEGLSIVTGRTVRISLAGGSIEGKVAGVESDALVVHVRKTSDRSAYPKGTLRVPREKLHVLEMQTKSKWGRAVLTPVGALLGVGGGAAIGSGIQGCGSFDIFVGCHPRNQGAAAGVFIGVAAAGVIGGYFAGNSLDNHWTAVEILP